jgi:hypothetical protein
LKEVYFKTHPNNKRDWNKYLSMIKW